MNKDEIKQLLDLLIKYEKTFSCPSGKGALLELIGRLTVDWDFKGSLDG